VYETEDVEEVVSDLNASVVTWTDKTGRERERERESLIIYYHICLAVVGMQKPKYVKIDEKNPYTLQTISAETRHATTKKWFWKVGSCGM